MKKILAIEVNTKLTLVYKNKEETEPELQDIICPPIREPKPAPKPYCKLSRRAWTVDFKFSFDFEFKYTPKTEILEFLKTIFITQYNMILNF